MFNCQSFGVRANRSIQISSNKGKKIRLSFEKIKNFLKNFVWKIFLTFANNNKRSFFLEKRRIQNVCLKKKKEVEENVSMIDS